MRGFPVVPMVQWGHSDGELKRESENCKFRKSCHPDQAQRVEGSTHWRGAVQVKGAKILRLPTVAQDDKNWAGRRWRGCPGAYPPR